MKINKTTVQKLMVLAKLKFNKKESENMFLDFKKILKFVDKLDEVNTEHIKPLTHVHEHTNIYREDIISNMISKDYILQLSPKHDSDYIKVPKVVKKKNNL